MLTDLDRKSCRKLHGDCHGLHCGNLRTSGPKWPAPVPEAWWGTVRLACLLEALQFGGYRFRFSNISVLEIHSRRVVLRNAGYMYRVIVGTAYSDRYPYPTKATHHNLWGRWIPHGHNPLWSLLGKAAAVYAISICGLFPYLSVRCSYGLWIRAMKYHIARFVHLTIVPVDVLDLLAMPSPESGFFFVQNLSCPCRCGYRSWETATVEPPIASTV